MIYIHLRNDVLVELESVHQASPLPSCAMQYSSEVELPPAYENEPKRRQERPMSWSGILETYTYICMKIGFAIYGVPEDLV